MAGLVTFTLASFERSRVPSLLASVPRERLRLRRLPGLAWGRHLGTSAGGRTLGADLARWAWFCCWDDDDAAAAAGFHDALAARLAPVEAATLHLRPVRARGRWAGHEVPLADGGAADPKPIPLVVLTRARVRPTRWRPFRAATPPVDTELAQAPGLLRSVGVGEWPVLVQGTLSVWRDVRAMTSFAGSDAHRVVVRRTGNEGWYSEELFARFGVERTQGTWDGAAPTMEAAP